MQGYHPSYSYVMVSWLRWWIPQMTCGKLFLLLHSLATIVLLLFFAWTKKNLFWRLPSWVNLLSLFLVKNEDVSVWFNIIWLGMQIEIRVKYQGWWKFYILKILSSIGYSHRYRKNSNKKRVTFWTKCDPFLVRNLKLDRIMFRWKLLWIRLPL